MTEKEKLLQWLDKLAGIRKEFIDNAHYEGGMDKFVIDDQPLLHIAGSLSDICEAIGVTPVKVPFASEEATGTKVSLVHNGITFFTLEDFRRSHAAT